MSERIVRLLLAIGFFALALLGLVWLLGHFRQGVPFDGATGWFSLFLFGLSYAAVCLIRPARP